MTRRQALLLSTLGLPLSRPSFGQQPGKQDKVTRRVAVSVHEAQSSQTDLIKHAEHCSVSPLLLQKLGRKQGEQIRIYRNDDQFAVFTIAEIREESNPLVVRLGRSGRLRTGAAERFEGFATHQVPADELSEDQAREKGELIEKRVDDGRSQELLILAPHGGEIEPYTDREAEHLLKSLPMKAPAAWICKGFRPNPKGSASQRWHITSSDISEASYPQLGRVGNRKYRFVVSFHGMTEERILIGGLAPTSLRSEIRDAIREAINDLAVPVDLARVGDSFAGSEPSNIVNRYATDGGIQIEQSARARSKHWKAIAESVAKVLSTH